MPIRFTCACGREHTVADAQAGQEVRCSACGSVQVVPGSVTREDEGWVLPLLVAGGILALGLAASALLFRESPAKTEPTDLSPEPLPRSAREEALRRQRQEEWLREDLQTEHERPEAESGSTGSASADPADRDSASATIRRRRPRPTTRIRGNKGVKSVRRRNAPVELIIDPFPEEGP